MGLFGDIGDSISDAFGGSDDDSDSSNDDNSTGGTPGYGGQTGSDTANDDNPDSTGGTPGVGGQTGGDSSDDSDSSDSFSDSPVNVGGGGGGSSDSGDDGGSSSDSGSDSGGGGGGGSSSDSGSDDSGGGGGSSDSDSGGGGGGGLFGGGGSSDDDSGGGDGGSDDSDSGGSTGGTPGFGGQTGSDTANDDNPDSTGGTPGVGGQTGSNTDTSDTPDSTGGTPGVGGQTGTETPDTGGSSDSDSNTPDVDQEMGTDSDSTGDNGSSPDDAPDPIDSSGDLQDTVESANELGQEVGGDSESDQTTDPVSSTDPTQETESGLNVNQPGDGEANAPGNQGPEAKAFEKLQDQTEATLQRSDVAISQEGETVNAELKDSGLRKEGAARREDIQPEDLLVSRDDRVFLSLDAQREDVAEGIEGVDPSDVLIQEQRQRDTPRVDSAGDLAAATSGRRAIEGDIVTSIELTNEGAAAAGPDTPPVVDAVAGVAGIDADEAAQEGREQRDDDTGEAFGGRGVVERTLRSNLRGFEGTVVDPAAKSTGDVFGAANELGEDIEVNDGVDSSDGAVGLPNEQQAEGVVEGVGTLPRLALAPIEAGEFAAEGARSFAALSPAVEGGKRDATGFVTQTGVAAAATAADLNQAAQRNPDRFFGQIAGSSAGTAGAIKAGRVAGGARGGRAVSTVIQPGEEALTFAGRRVGGPVARVANRVGDVSVNRNRNSFVSDESGQLTLGRINSDAESESEVDGNTPAETDATSSGLLDQLQDSLERAGRANRARNAEQRGRDQAREKVESEPPADARTVSDDGPGGDFTSTQDPEVRAASNTGSARTSGPTASQQRAFAQSRRTNVEQTFESRKTDQDLRAADQARQKSDQDLRDQAEAREVTAAEAQTGVIENTAIGLLRGTGSRSGVTAQAQQRRLEAQQPFAGVGTNDILGGRNGIRTEVSIRDVLGTDTETGQDARQDARAKERAESGLESRGETRQETRSEVGSETRQETRQETRLETRSENRSETRQEARIETRSETRQEPIVDPEDPEKNVMNELFGGSDGNAGAVLTNFRNPLTGNVLETDPDST